MEIWKDIPGYEGLYQVSNLGRVKSLHYGKTNTERVLVSKTLGYGYRGVKLYSSPRHPTSCYIHRLVALAFLPNPNNLPQVNHRDENKSNNAVSNLEWCSAESNVNYGTARERAARKVAKPVVQMKNGQIVRIWKSCTETKEFGFVPTKITQCCRGSKKTHHGYEWRYAT